MAGPTRSWWSRIESREPERPQGYYVRGVFRLLEGNLHVGLGAQVVYLVGLGIIQDPTQQSPVRQITIV